MTPDRATQIVTGRPTLADLVRECRDGYRPTIRVFDDDTQEQAEAALVLRAALRAEGCSQHPHLLSQEALRVPGLTSTMVYRLESEAALMEPPTLGAALRAGKTYVEAPADVLAALYERIENAELPTDAGETETQAAFARRAQEQSRLAMLARLADALGQRGQAATMRAKAKRLKLDV